MLGVPEALAVASGTAAMHLALIVNDVHAGDEVIVPPTPSRRPQKW